MARISATAVSVAFEESHDTLALDDQAQYKLLKLANDVTYKRIKTLVLLLLKAIFCIQVIVLVVHAGYRAKLPLQTCKVGPHFECMSVLVTSVLFLQCFAEPECLQCWARHKANSDFVW